MTNKIETFINKLRFINVSSTKRKQTKRRKVTMSKEKYKSKDKLHDRNKLICNQIFVRLAKRNKGKCLILDAETLRTTKALNKIGIKYSEIYVPNPYCFEQIKKKAPKGLNISNQLLGDFINEYYLPTDNVCMSNAWFDYCGTFEGNKECNPREDIFNYFNRGIPREAGIFAVTFKTARISKDYVYQDIIEADCYIQETAYSRGYVLVKVNQRFYKGMCFMIYKIHPANDN